MSENQSNKPQSQQKSWLKSRWGFLWKDLSVVGLVVVVLIGTFFGSAIWTTSERALTPLEQTLFQVILIILTFLFSWIVAKRKEEENVLARR